MPNASSPSLPPFWLLRLRLWLLWLPLPLLRLVQRARLALPERWALALRPAWVLLVRLELDWARLLLLSRRRQRSPLLPLPRRLLPLFLRRQVPLPPQRLD